jgi:hypothetical protein
LRQTNKKEGSQDDSTETKKMTKIEGTQTDRKEGCCCQTDRQTTGKDEGSETDDGGTGKEVTADDSSPNICSDMFFVYTLLLLEDRFKSLTICKYSTLDKKATIGK